MANTSLIWIPIVFVDVLSIVLIYTPWIVLVWGPVEPFERGFYCDDESLSYPYNDSTIPGVVMEALGFIIPAVFVLSIELVYSNYVYKSSTLVVYKLGRLTVHPFFIAFYKLAVIFTFGAALQQSISNICKYSTGRLRPHFFDVCNITLTPELCLDEQNRSQYVTNYTCTGVADDVKDARLSFFSGHTSNATYTAVFVIIYLQFRFPDVGKLKIWRILLQIILGFYCVLMGLSRIQDYKHHWSDVLGGGIVGMLCAVYTSLFVSNLLIGGIHKIYEDTEREENLSLTESTRL